MKTGLKKSQKTTEIFFDEANPMVEIRTHNTGLKKRLTAYAADYPDLCKLTDEDEETGYKCFEIANGASRPPDQAITARNVGISKPASKRISNFFVNFGNISWQHSRLRV